MRNNLSVFFNSVLGGIMIGIGGTVYLSCENKVVGSLLFAIGLMTICVYQMALFTGKIGYIVSSKPIYLLECAVVWLGNLVGTTLVAFGVALAKPSLFGTIHTVASGKLNQNWYTALILGILCGLLMFIAVDNFRNEKSHVASKYIGIFACVSTFILAGFEHSIADMYYFMLATFLPISTTDSFGFDMGMLLNGFAFILIVTLGNVLGSFIIPLGKKYAVAAAEK
ncbi:MAG: formate/nitrite transporter family protein [Oscillospiraceae bacterium]|jgi:nitrite transporter NirC|nr:formate/nitrite transporter family protein [Oscillospiraceae bacterium]